MKSLTKDELGRFLDVTGSDRLMFTVMFNHGLRVSEVIALTDANVIDGHLVVQRLKGSKKTTQKLLPDELALVGMKGQFFPLCRMTVWRRMQAYGAKVGIPKHLLHPHSLKHTCGRLGYKGGMGVAELVAYLGHKNPGNSLIYMEADESEACSAFAAAVGK
jgi:type 1 fimbriae regulatory protein FimB